MKENKTRQLRIRITENQLSTIINFLKSSDEFKSQSELIRESIRSRICRTEDISSKTKNNR